ncbi:MAG: cell division protein FtsZ, partial [Rhodobacteraceae bacterium]|nr:cell division protein FtsZ [Paracoccaceae bacterium]
LRFGINSLINRMTGHPGELPRQQPPLQRGPQQAAPYDDEATDPDQERIEIPAFLRRQAN